MYLEDTTKRGEKRMVGAIIAGTFFAVLSVIILIFIYLIKTLKVGCLDEAYKMYLLENGYRQPTEEEIKEYYSKSLKRLKK